MRKPLHTLFSESLADRKWTYEELHARLMDYSWTPGVKPPALATVGHWCNGTRRPRKMEHLAAMCQVLDLSLDDVLVQNEDEAKTAIEQKVIRGLRGLDPAQQEYVLATITMLKGKS